MILIMEVKNSKCVNGKGLFVKEKYVSGDIIFVLSGTISSKPTRESIHVGNNKHIHDQFGIYINHSFTPNIRIEGLNVVAICDIEKDTEIMFNYNETEVNMACPFCIEGEEVKGRILE